MKVCFVGAGSIADAISEIYITFYKEKKLPLIYCVAEMVLLSTLS